MCILHVIAGAAPTPRLCVNILRYLMSQAEVGRSTAAGTNCCGSINLGNVAKHIVQRAYVAAIALQTCICNRSAYSSTSLSNVGELHPFDSTCPGLAC